MRAPARRIGILAGGGSLPREVAECAAKRGHAVHILAIEGEAERDFGSVPVTSVGWGEIHRMIRVLRAARATELVIVGRVLRPDLLRIRKDLGFVLALPAILSIVASGGDDSVLRVVVRFFESKGFRVVGPCDVAPELVIEAGPMGRAAPEGADVSDIARGFDVVRALGAHDMGQSVVVTNGAVEAVEGAEGTDGMLERVAAARRGAREPRRGVLVKRTKPGQELRVDMPAIGPETVARVAAAGLKGVAVEAGRALAARRAELIERADAASVFAAGWEDASGNGAAAPMTQVLSVPRLGRLGAVAPRARDRADIGKGAATLTALSPFKVGRAAVVTRRHVLGVETGEGLAALLSRVSRLRQWGDGPAHRRVGVAVIADARDVDGAAVAAAAAAGLRGVAVIGDGASGDRMREAIELADRTGLFIVAPCGRRGEAV